LGTLIDSGVFIASERGRLDLDRLFQTIAFTTPAIAAITVAELMLGVELANAVHRPQRLARVEAVVRDYRVIDFNAAIAETYARLTAQLRVAGTPLQPHDVMIAATALHEGLTVITRDKRSFPLIPNLQVTLV
jgi:tRNA(fMet)-specific endonuclease VapC